MQVVSRTWNTATYTRTKRTMEAGFSSSLVVM